MNQSFKKHFNAWINDTDERAKLQHAYLAIAVVVVLISGILSLLDAPLGRNMVGIAVGALFIFIVNAVVWALLYSFTARLEKKPAKKASTKKK